MTLTQDFCNSISLLNLLRAQGTVGLSWKVYKFNVKKSISLKRKLMGFFTFEAVMLWQVVSSGVVTYVQVFTDISLDLDSPMYSPYHINSRLRLQLNANNQELSVGTANTLASIGHSFAFTKWLKVLNIPCLTHICFAVKYLYYKLAPQSIVFVGPVTLRTLPWSPYL